MKIIPKEMKRRARIALTGNYFPAVSLTVSLTLLTTALTLLIQQSGLYLSADPLNQILYWVLYLIALLFGALLEAGLLRFLYSLCKGKPLRERGILFSAFRNQADTYILTYAFRYLVSLVWFVPSLYFYMQLPVVIDLTEIPADLPYLLGMSLLLAAIALIPAVLFALPYCLAIYVLLDDPNRPARDALRQSRRLTRGQRGRIFRLWLGFLPLCLLGIGSFGIGFLWIRPYFHTAMGEVYLELMGHRTAADQQPQSSQNAFGTQGTASSGFSSED